MKYIYNPSLHIPTVAEFENADEWILDEDDPFGDQKHELRIGDLHVYFNYCPFEGFQSYWYGAEVGPRHHLLLKSSVEFEPTEKGREKCWRNMQRSIKRYLTKYHELCKRGTLL